MNPGVNGGPARHPLPAALLEGRLIAVLRAGHARDCWPVVDVLVANGIRMIELTLTTPGALDALPEIRRHTGSDAIIGVGTITTRSEASASLEAGADFLVTPIHVPGVAEVALGGGVPVFPGAFTPTEIHRTWSEGATAVKVFPASAVGPSIVRELAGPFPDIPLMPSGGVGLDAIPLWLGAGAVAVSLGGSLIGDAFSGDIDALAVRARRATDAVREWQHRP